jgi:hypothetical protein
VAETPFVKKFLAAASTLPSIPSRTVYHDEKKTRFYTKAQYDALAANDKNGLVAQVLDEEYYYNTKYGSPLSYYRALDVLVQHGAKLAPGARFLDFGYGYVGHLRLLATLGRRDGRVYPRARCSTASLRSGPMQGDVRGASASSTASSQDPKVAAPWAGLRRRDLEERAEEGPYPRSRGRCSITWSRWVPRTRSLARFFDTVKPGGFFLICSSARRRAPDKPFVPWSDGRSPWAKEQYEAAGFKVVEINHDDFKPSIGWLTSSTGTRTRTKRDDNDLGAPHAVQRPENCAALTTPFTCPAPFTWR